MGWGDWGGRTGEGEGRKWVGWRKEEVKAMKAEEGGEREGEEKRVM